MPLRDKKVVMTPRSLEAGDGLDKTFDQEEVEKGRWWERRNLPERHGAKQPMNLKDWS